MASIMLSANEARQNPIRETVVHDEVRGIESAILNAVKNGLYETTVNFGTPMTSGNLPGTEVESIDTLLNQFFIPNHPYKTGDLISIYSDTTLPSPLKQTEFYAVIYVDENHIKLATTKANAYNSIPISIDLTNGVNDIIITNPGSGYSSVPQVTVSPSELGMVATAYANLANYGSISSVSLSSKGSGYTDVPSIVFQSQGSGAVVNVIKFLSVNVTIAAAGLNYRLGDTLSIVGGMGVATTLIVTGITNTGAVTSVSIKNRGLYTALPVLSGCSTTASPGGGTGCTLNLIMGIGGLEIDTNLPYGSNGIGYTAPPVVIISGGNGNGAEAEALISAGRVVGFNILHYGSGYNSSPTIELSTGAGTVATAIITPTSVANIAITNNGGNTYSTVPNVTITSTGLYAEAGIVTMRIVNASIVSKGSGYLKGETVLISGGAGSDNASILITNVGSLGEIIDYSLVTSGAYTVLPLLTNNAVIGGSGKSASFTLTAGVNSITVTYSGLGYTVPPLIRIISSNGAGIGAAARAILSVDEVSDIVMLSAGTGYTAVPTVSITSGTGATANAYLTPTGISKINILSPGLSYINPELEFIGDGGDVEYDILLDGNGGIIDIIINNSGSGFTSVPDIIVIDDVGSSAILQAELIPTSISHISVTNGGQNYTCLPGVEIPGSATAVSYLSSTSIDRIDITAEGTNWTSLPVIHTVPGPNQVGTPVPPSATATIGYSVKNVAVTYAGSGYNVAPSVAITPPGGLGTPATAVAYIGPGISVVTVNSYSDSRDYYKVWKGMTPSDPMLSRPYQERMDTVISYLTSMGYTITRQTNPSTNNTIQWSIMW